MWAICWWIRQKGKDGVNNKWSSNVTAVKTSENHNASIKWKMIDDELKRRASYTFQSDIITMRGKRTKWIYTDKKDQRFKESLDF